MSTIRDLITNPSKINSTTLNTVNYNYQAALCQSLIVIEDDMLIFREPVCGGYTRLQLVPAEFYNIIFVVFHFKCNWRTSQCLPYISLYLSTLLMAWDVLLH